MENCKILITGASGLLGRAARKIFEAEEYVVYGTAFSRAGQGQGLELLDLMNEEAVRSLVLRLRPEVVLHTAAMRFPDLVDANPDAAIRLNVDATASLCRAAAEVGAPVLYISTDYVFDGHHPPYLITDKPNPVNLYGRTKMLGEEATLAVNTGNMVLRVPVLYGPVEKLSESAVTVLAEAILDTTQPRRLSHYERRYPSHVDDIAHICRGLLRRKLQDPSLAGIFHWSGKEVFTKYEMAVQMAEVFGLPHSHLSPEPSSPVASAAARPYDTCLDTSRLSDLGLGTHTSFKMGIRAVLQPWMSSAPVAQST